MAAGKREQNEVLLFKIESTYGTDPTPVEGTNAILTRGPVSITDDGERMNPREAVRAGLGELQDVYGGHLVRVAFECEVKGSGAAGTAPEIGPLLRACGFEETVVASTSVTYAPENAVHESGTFYFFEGGTVRHIVTGARGTVAIRGEAGGIATCRFEFLGKYSAPTDESLPSPTYNSQVPKAVVGMALTVNGVSGLTVQNWEWDFKNECGANDSVTASDGYGEVIIRRRRPSGAMQLELESMSTINFDTLRTAGTRFSWASGTLGSVAGNRVVVSTPSSSTYVRLAPKASVNGIAGRSVEFGVDDSVGQPSVVFT